MSVVMDVAIFSQLFTEGYRKYGPSFNKDPLFWAVLLKCLHSAWRGEGLNDAKLSQGQFFLSKQKYAEFGLKESQANKISRKLDALQKLGFIKKVDNRRGRNNATIYQFLPNVLMIPPWMMGNTTGNGPKKTGNGMDINKENIKENNKRERISPEDGEKLIKSIRGISKELMIPFTTEDHGGYINKLLSDQTYNEIIVPLEERFNQGYTRREWVAKIYKYAMSKENDDFWQSKISSFKLLYKHLSDLASLFLSSKK